MDEIFEEWNAYTLQKKLIQRDINLEKLLSDARLKIIGITGVRRSGKSSLLMLLAQKLASEKQKVAYVNLEDSRIKNSETVLDDILKWFGESGYLLLDEITSIHDWDGWLAHNHELLKGNLKLIVSSSRRNLVTPKKALRGRVLTFELFPLSFKEFLKFKNINFEKTTVGRGRIEKAFEEYLIYGGFPEVVLMNDSTDKIRLLNSYFRDIIGLDVSEISNENITTVELFGKYVIDSPYFSASKCLNFFKSVGHRIGKQSLLQLEKFSQEGYLFYFMSIFSYSIKNRLQYPRKAYAGDNGFLYSTSGKIEMGRLYENATYLELRRQLEPQYDIHYWKNVNGLEADFIIRRGVKVVDVIQIAYDIRIEKTRKREISGLLSCAHEFGLKKGKIFTKNTDEIKKIEGVEVKFVPLWKFLSGYN